MTVDEQEIVDEAKLVKKLMDDKVFQKVILEGYMEGQAISLGTNFDGLEEELDTLKAITNLKRYLDSRVENGIIVVQSTNKG